MKTKNANYSFFILLLFVVASCGNNLSKDNASKMIIENAKTNDDIQYLSLSFAKYDFYDFQSGIKYNDYLSTNDFSKLSSLEKDGYIRILLPMDDNKKAIINFTPKAEEFIVKSKSNLSGGKYIAVGKMKEVNVTGIKETGDKTCTVESTIIYEKTPFGILCNDSEFNKNIETSFTLYDDGWRIGK